MHDPMVVVFDLTLPLPKRTRWKDAREGQHRWVERRRRTNAENLSQPVYPWYRPSGYTVRFAGRGLSLRKAATIWHVEPEGRDSGTVCKGRRGSDFNLHNVRWAWEHRRHLDVQVHLYQRLHNWLFTRCAACGHRFFWKQSRHGYMGGDDTYHRQCMDLRQTRGQLDDAAKALTFTATETERWRVERWLAWREERAQKSAARAIGGGV